MITAKAITVIQTRKTSINHWVLHSLRIVILALKLFFSDSRALRCQYLVLYAILLETLFIACTPPPRTEAPKQWQWTLETVWLKMALWGYFELLSKTLL